MRVLGIIPARGGSKRLAGKNIKKLNGRPLVDYVMHAAQDSTSLDRVVLTSDDSAILDRAWSFPDIAAIRRPAELSTDLSPAIDYVRHALGILGDQEEVFDVIVIIQPTSPFTLAQDIDDSISLLNETGADTVVGVVKVDHMVNPVKLKIIENGQLLPYIEDEAGRMAHHHVPQVYVRNCSIYACTRQTIDQGMIIGPNCQAYLMPRERSIDINDSLDFEFAEFLIQRGR